MTPKHKKPLEVPKAEQPKEEPQLHSPQDDDYWRNLDNAENTGTM